MELITNKTEDVNVRCKNKKTPLHLAAEKGHSRALEILFSNEKVNITAKDSNRRTAFHWATESCKFLAQHRGLMGSSCRSVPLFCGHECGLNRL